jgi:hypothetical protein
METDKTKSSLFENVVLHSCRSNKRRFMVRDNNDIPPGIWTSTPRKLHCCCALCPDQLLFRNNLPPSASSGSSCIACACWSAKCLSFRPQEERAARWCRCQYLVEYISSTMAILNSPIGRSRMSQHPCCLKLHSG